MVDSHKGSNKSKQYAQHKYIAWREQNGRHLAEHTARQNTLAWSPLQKRISEANSKQRTHATLLSTLTEANIVTYMSGRRVALKLE